MKFAVIAALASSVLAQDKIFPKVEDITIKCMAGACSTDEFACCTNEPSEADSVVDVPVFDEFCFPKAGIMEDKFEFYDEYEELAATVSISCN